MYSQQLRIIVEGLLTITNTTTITTTDTVSERMPLAFNYQLSLKILLSRLMAVQSKFYLNNNIH